MVRLKTAWKNDILKINWTVVQKEQRGTDMESTAAILSCVMLASISFLPRQPLLSEKQEESIWIFTFRKRHSTAEKAARVYKKNKLYRVFYVHRFQLVLKIMVWIKERREKRQEKRKLGRMRERRNVKKKTEVKQWERLEGRSLMSFIFLCPLLNTASMSSASLTSTVCVQWSWADAYWDTLQAKVRNGEGMLWK